MNRSLTAAFAAFEALLVLGLGVAIPLAPLTVLWAAQFGFAIDWIEFWRAAVDVWLLGHGVDVLVTLDPATAAGLALPGAEAPFELGIAVLGFALLTLLLAVRAGRRVAEVEHRLVGELVSIGTFAVFSALAALSAMTAYTRPSLPQSVLLPTAVFALGFAIGLLRVRGLPRLLRWVDDWPNEVRAASVVALRGGTAAAFAVVAVASVPVALLIFGNYARIISLYEGLHVDVVGSVSITIAQLALLPNIVIWAATWLIGPGFALGTGSAVSPLGTELGPIPAIPLLGALPEGESPFGFLGLLVPVVLGFFAGLAVRAPLLRDVKHHRLPWVIGTGLAVGLVGGLVLALLAWASGGAAGPGRLATIGPDPVAVGLFAAVEIGVAAVLGMLSGRAEGPVLEHADPEPVTSTGETDAARD